jgi:hypothetical protein
MRLLASAVLATALFAGCGSTVASPAPPSTAPSVAPSSPSAAIDVDTLLAGAAGLEGQPVRVKGFILVTEAGASMCSLLLESYPPQCGGGVLVTGEIPADVAVGLEKTTDPGLTRAMWGWVEVAGTFEASDAGGSIALSEVRLAAP